MATNSNGVPLYTDQDLLDQARASLAAAMQAQSYTVSGRSKQMAEIARLTGVITWLEQRINDDANGAGGNVALTQFGDVDLSGPPFGSR